MLHSRALVFVSSAMRGTLTNLRADLERAITSLDLVDAWMFEFHAVASGEPPSEQYLNYARNCDLFVLLVGDAGSEATEQEYEVARADNALKVLPFLVGDGGPETEAFRALLRSRHTTPRVTSGELVSAVTSAVSNAVTTAKVVVPALTNRSKSALDAQLALTADDPRLCLVPMLHPMGDAASLSLPGQHDRLVLLGGSGAGKSFALGVWLQQRASSAYSVPLVLRPRVDQTDAYALIDEAFDAVRFRPGRELVEEYGREGRMAIAVDGLDDLPSERRAQFLDGLVAFADRFPRTAIAVAARTLPLSVLPGFAYLNVARLGDDTIGSVFEAYGTAVRVDSDIPSQFRDLVTLPLWAILLAQRGASFESGTQLLETLVQHRLGRAFPGDPIRQEKIASVLGFMAWELRPRLTVLNREAMSFIESWRREGAIARRYEIETDEGLLRAAGNTGLVYREDDQIRYAHLLLATTLACRWLLGRSSLPELPLDDRDLCAFVAASLGEDRSTETLDLLAKCDIYTVAMAARLSPQPARHPQEDDIQTYTAALGRLGTLAGDADRPIVIQGGSWSAIADQGQPRVATANDEEFWEWARPQSGATRTYTLWPSSPFQTRSPIWLAADQAVRQFKERVRRIAPPGDRFARVPPETVRAHMDDPTKRTDNLLETARRWASIRNDLLGQIDLKGVAHPPPWSGEPQLIARRGSKETRIHLQWGYDSPEIQVVDEEPEYRGIDVGAFLVPDPTARIYHDLVDEIEQLLGGSSIESEALRNPSRLPAVTWR